MGIQEKTKKYLGLSDSALVNLSPRLRNFRRDGRLLMVEPETASWLILEGKDLEFFQRIRFPLTAWKFLNLGESQTLGWEGARSLLERLYQNGILELNGKSFYDPRVMWRLPRKYPGFLCLHPTHACNFSCLYCLARAHIGRPRMQIFTGERIVERLLRELPLKEMCIDFHGGEPFLAFEEMVAIMSHARVVAAEVGKKVTFRIQSNGSLLTKEKVGILKGFDLSLGISIDGPPEIHNRCRVYPDGSGTFTEAWRGYQIAKDAGFSVGCLAVVHEPKNYMPTFEFFISQGLRSFRINYSSYIGRATDELEFPVERAEAFAGEYLKMVDLAFSRAKEMNTPILINDVDNQINNLVSKERPFMCYRSPCGMGNSILGFSPEGGIYACEENAGLDVFKVGDIFTAGPLDRLVEESSVLKEVYRRTVDNIPKCRNCTFKRFCGGGCTSKTFARYGEIMRESPMCRYYQIVFEELMWRIHERPEMVNLLGKRNC